MKPLRICALATAAALCLAALPGCSQNEEEQEEIRVYTSLLCQNSTAIIAPDNDLQQVIAEKIGAKCIETWLNERDSEEKLISDMILSGKYPDFLYPTSITQQKLLNANAFIPIDEYWDEYPNIRNYFSEQKWNSIRQEDGHIYYIPAFSNCYLYDTATIHNDEAFWVQVQVLQWAGYPKITTLDDYFDLLERYIEANPVGANGQPNIAYEILADESIFFCLDNPPMFLSGSPNDGACIVDPDTHQVIDYNTTDAARKWFKKLNEEYHKGIVDPECFVLSPDQYYDKLRSGNVLGMVDQYWNFSYATDALPDVCQYVPLGVVLEEGIEEHYHSQLAFDPSSGLGITVNCEDVDGALKFVNDLLDPEIHRLRFWGVEGVDYSVGEDGVFYLTEQQKEFAAQADYYYQHRCVYSYFPFYSGMDRDEINGYRSSYQPTLFYENLSDIMKECFDAYGVRTFVEMLNPAGENQPWYPMWSYTNTFTDQTPGGKARSDIEKTKFRYMPRVVMSDDFDAAWEEYMTAYSQNCDVDAYVDALQAYVDQRVGG